MKYRVIGNNAQTVAIEIQEKEAIFTRLGRLLFARGSVNAQSSPQGTYWTVVTDAINKPGDPPIVLMSSDGASGLIGLKSPSVGRIHVVNLESISKAIIKRSAILAAQEGLRFDPVHLDGEDAGKIIPGLFVTVSGSGKVFLHGSGNLVDFSLGDSEKMVADGQFILALYGEIDYSPRPVGSPYSIDTEPYMLMMHLTGPGRVVLQTMH
ncbi:MAG: AIM24 family protein [bacterium]